MTKQTFDQYTEELWVTAVQVATVWTSPTSAREIDTPGTTNPTNIDQWIDSLSYESTVALCDENRVQSQLLYGEAVIVTEVKDDWAHVIVPTQPSKKDNRGYPGWVPFKQLEKVQKNDWVSEQYAAVVNDKATLEDENGDQFMKVSFMTVLPVETTNNDRIEVKTPHGKRFVPAHAVQVFDGAQGLPKRAGTAIVQSGEPYVSLDYFWGGMSSFGFDCSGFAYAMHRANGYQIPRDAGDQANLGGEEIAYDHLLPGDLLFFAYEEGKGKLHHVGIYYGNGKMIHSPQTGKGIEIITLKDTVYDKEFCGARRYWQNTEEK
ncbi:NlpC/P60 family protein [Virgibacillus byunsanensis]|uniref:NlpC/P60 family protein n=1 Tax=Virgibacillus byunsanensis TaxID=570945 RepID=A0ABW3LFN4_9BACI